MNLTNINFYRRLMENDLTPVESDTPSDIVDVDAIDNDATAIQTRDDIADITDQIVDTENKIELLAARLVELQHYRDFVKKKGVNKTFLSLANDNDQLSKLLGFRIPACESFGATGDPLDRTSKDVVAGLENVIKSIWEWIKNLASRVAEAVSKFIKSIFGFANDMETVVNQIQEALNKYEPGSRPTKSVEIEGVSLSVLNQKANAFVDSWDKYLSDPNTEVDFASLLVLYVGFADKKKVDLTTLTREDIQAYVDELNRILKVLKRYDETGKKLQQEATEQANNAKKNAQSADGAENKETAEQAKKKASDLSAQIKNYKVAGDVLINIMRMGVRIPNAWVKAASKGTTTDAASGNKDKL